MTHSLVDAESVMAVDIGSIATRAMLFDVVEGQYRFVSAGTAPSTTEAPFHDVGESIHQAFENLQEITGQTLLDDSGSLIIPTQPNGSGVDRLVVTYSCGPDLRLVVAGMLSDVSLESALRLAATTYGRVVETIGLNDKRRPEMRLDAILQADPDLIIVAGGTEKGASRSVLKLVELIQAACMIIPAEKRPEILYAGNSVLSKKVTEMLERYTRVHIAANVRPSIDVENLNAAADSLAEVISQVRSRRGQVGGMQLLCSICSVPPLPAAYGLGRIIRFLSQVYPAKGVLGVDVGSNSTTFATAFSGKLSLNVFRYGIGSGAGRVLQQSRLEDVTQWLPMHISPEVVRDYLWQKSLEPSTIPATVETLAIEQALARQVLRLGMYSALVRSPWISPSFEPILIGGAVLGKAPNPLQSLMMVLDGLQPEGITTIVLDQNGLSPALGAIAKFNPVLPVQVLESGVFVNLGTVICPVSSARYGNPILNVRLEYEQGSQSGVEIRQGSLVSLPLNPGQTALLHLDALHDTQVDPRGKSGSTSFKIVGGICGAVVDARGRPLVLPTDDARRRDLIRKWALALGI